MKKFEQKTHLEAIIKNKKDINDSRINELKERREIINEKDRKFKEDKERKRLKHEEELFQLDLERA